MSLNGATVTGGPSGDAASTSYRPPAPLAASLSGCDLPPVCWTSLSERCVLATARPSRMLSLRRQHRRGSGSQRRGFRRDGELTNARIGAELRLGSKGPRAGALGKRRTLILRNTHCASLQDRWPTTKEPEAPAWPAEIDLEGFTYDLLGGLLGRRRRAGRHAGAAGVVLRGVAGAPSPVLAAALRAAGEGPAGERRAGQGQRHPLRRQGAPAARLSGRQERGGNGSACRC